ncbi:hypothetical protein HMPREF9413_2709 [Paenibacillus sp. HGF7]|nr:hypothetical protein HMPREF9413_2709 [Paenibacillus sp. HGF7]
MFLPLLKKELYNPRQIETPEPFLPFYAYRLFKNQGYPEGRRI